MLFIAAFLLPYYILRENAYFMIHDELDDGIFKNILYGRNFGINKSFIPEFMGGQDRHTITISTFFGIFIYKFLPPYAAFVVMYTIVVLIGYIGVFLLGKEISGNAVASFIAACIFSYLPFKSMFGLNIVGFPLLIWILLKLSKMHEQGYMKYYIFLVLYASGITLAWAGYMAIGLLPVAIVIAFFADKKFKVNIPNLIVAEGILIVTQIITSWDLIKSTFFIGEKSHREELVLSSYTNLLALFKDMMFIGGSHSECCSKVIALSAIVLIIGVPFLIHFLKKAGVEKASEIKKKYIIMCIFYGANVLNAIFTCFYCSVPIVWLRQMIGGVIKTFQINRIYWIMPTCWIGIFILEIAIFCDIAIILFTDKAYKKIKFIAAVPIIVSLALAFIYSRNVYLSSPFYHNIRLMVFPDTYHVDSWRKYYAEDLYEEIAGAIGKDKSEYRVVSLGVNPAVALFNGFYTIDGYSTDYPLKYKHDFRKIIEKELENNANIRAYFDNWGNRCYLYTNGLNGDFDIYRGEDIETELEINMDELKNMGADYIFSAVKIANADELGLYEISDEPFIKDEDSYAIRVYEVR